MRIGWEAEGPKSGPMSQRLSMVPDKCFYLLTMFNNAFGSGLYKISTFVYSNVVSTLHKWIDPWAGQTQQQTLNALRPPRPGSQPPSLLAEALS